jgi:hypothetical protein
LAQQLGDAMSTWTIIAIVVVALVAVAIGAWTWWKERL